MPIRLPACRRPGDASTYLYAGNYEGSCAACERDPSLVLTGLWGGNVSICRADALRVGMDSSFTYHEDRDFGLRCMKAGLRGRFDRSLHADHVHARNDRDPPAGRPRARGRQGQDPPGPCGRASAVRRSQFAHDLPAPVGRVMVACRRPRLAEILRGRPRRHRRARRAAATLEGRDERRQAAAAGGASAWGLGRAGALLSRDFAPRVSAGTALREWPVPRASGPRLRVR